MRYSLADRLSFRTIRCLQDGSIIILSSYHRGSYTRMHSIYSFADQGIEYLLLQSRDLYGKIPFFVFVMIFPLFDAANVIAKKQLKITY